jgi:hypothetical protein
LRGRPVLKRKTMDNESARAIFFKPPLCTEPELSDYMDHFPGFGKQSREALCVGTDSTGRPRGWVFTSNYQVLQTVSL